MGISLSQRKEQVIRVPDALFFRSIRNQPVALVFKGLSLLPETVHHFIQQRIAQISCSVITVGSFDHLHNTL